MSETGGSVRELLRSELVAWLLMLVVLYAFTRQFRLGWALACLPALFFARLYGRRLRQQATPGRRALYALAVFFLFAFTVNAAGPHVLFEHWFD